ncbi:MAG: helix-turn-helix domain-containing protein [Planctomycetota bacterium]
MPIRVRLDYLLLDRKMNLTDLSERVGISIANLSNLKTNKVRAIRFSTLEVICKALQCQPADLLHFVPESEDQ